MDEMLHAKIAFTIPFLNSNDALHEPALRVEVNEGESINFGISLFFIGLKPKTIYTVSCSVSPADDIGDFPIFVVSKKFAMENDATNNGFVPAAFDIPIDLGASTSTGQYKIETKLKSENARSDEIKNSISFIEIYINGER